MPEDRSPPQEAGIKPSIKNKWRGKLFSTEGRFGKGVEDLESTDNDVANFLHSGSTIVKARPQPAHLAPRIDTSVAPRFPTATQLSESTEIVDVYQRPKPRQNKGLHVTFHTATPEIIGEGGEEAELPSKAVSKSLQYPLQTEQLQIGDLAVENNDGTIQGSKQSLPVPVDDPTFKSKILHRTPTGLSAIFDDQILDSRDQKQEADSLSFSPSPPSKLKHLPQPPSPITPQQHTESEPISEEAYPDVSPLTDYGDDFDGLSPGQFRAALSPSISKNLGIPSPGILPGDSISPHPPPYTPLETHEGQSSAYDFPTTAFVSRTTPVLSGSKPIVNSQAIKEHQDQSKTKIPSLRQVAKDPVDDSLEEFDARVRRYNDFFRLGVSAHTDLMNVPFIQWIRAASWWFLKGRQGLENEVRSKSDLQSGTELSSSLKQAYVNLAKSWWLLKDIIPNHPEVAGYGKTSVNSLRAITRHFGGQSLAEQVEVHAHIVANLRALALSMKRNGKLPPPDLEIQRLDLHVLLNVPRIPKDIAGLLVNNVFATRTNGRPNIEHPFFPFPIGDTERHFNFARMFVEISKVLDDSTVDLRLPCVLTVLRDRNEWNVQVTLASQDGQVSLIISDEMNHALSWRSVQWQIHSYEMLLTTSTESEKRVKVQVQFMEKDFKTLWGICDYTKKARTNLLALKDEELVFERTLRKFQCDDATQFRSDPIDNCRLRVFESMRALTDSSVERKVHNGFRLIVITPPSLKALSFARYELGRENPILFSMYAGDDGADLIIRILPSSARVSLSFTKAEDIDALRNQLGGTLTTKEDRTIPSLQLQNLTILPKSPNEELSTLSHRHGFPWKRLRIVHTGSQSSGHGNVPKGLVNLRLMADTEYGTLTDRVTLTAGELRLGLSNENMNELKILRHPQTNMTWSLADQRAPKKDIMIVCKILNDMLAYPTIRTYHFRTLEDLHSFQTIITGFPVLFDRFASSFAIARRRAVLPVHKKWEATSARLQLVKHEKLVQLIAFFKDFSYGDCVNFVLKTTDVFEVFSKGGMFFLRIVDAKFPLPKGSDDENRGLVCLDLPEYPGEHDDITIGFDNEHGMLQHSLIRGRATD